MAIRPVTATLTQQEQVAPILYLPLRPSFDPQARLVALVREIDAHPHLSTEEKKLTRRAAAKLPIEQAITYIFLEVLGRAMEAATPNIESLFDRAQVLFDEQGDPYAFLGEGGLTGEIEELEVALEAWQEDLVGQLETNLREREALVTGAEQRVRSTLHAVHETATMALALADRMDQAESRCMSQLERLDQALKERNRHV